MFARNWILLVIVIVIILLGLIWLNSKLPDGYYLLESENYWDSELHRKIKCYKTKILDKDEYICSEQIVPSTIVDYIVKGDFILALKVNRDIYFSREKCMSCQTLSSPCAEYWAVNWRTKKQVEVMDKDGFKEFLSNQGIAPFDFDYKGSISALKYCDKEKRTR